MIERKAEHPSNERRRLRMLYSLHDLQLARSAAAFLCELGVDEPISKVELRRYKCYESTAIISYARPFTKSEGVPPLSLKMTGATLTESDMALHAWILDLRNKCVAHSDAQMMRMAVRHHSEETTRGIRLNLLHTVFDDGLHINGLELYHFMDLISNVQGSLYMRLYEEAKEAPELFHIDVDYLKENEE